ncbi:MAG: YitT family protein [Bulleidia sp.]
MTKKLSDRNLYRPIIVVIASIIMAFNIRMFVKVGGLYPGGATGLTVLTQAILDRFFHISVSYTLVNILWNAIPVYIGFRYIGKKFTFYSLVLILLSGFLVDIIPSRGITYDLLLISVFGGIINGFVVSLCLSFHTTTGGTDFISIFLSQKYNVDSFNMVLGLNVCILAVAGILFGWDKALYSIIYQYTSTQILHLLYRTYQQVTLLVISNRPHEIATIIHAKTKHGATIMDCEGAYTDEERKMVYSVINANSERAVISEIHRVDPHAFINCVRTKEIKGRFHQEEHD